MGTPGYVIYRYRNIYVAIYHRYDAYPESLGKSVLSSARTPDAITDLKQWLGKYVDEFTDSEESIEAENPKDIISRSRPAYYTLDAMWIYDIDIDRNIFQVNHRPFFRLDCLPNEEAFLEYVSEEFNDHYDNQACPPSCPPCHKYDTPAPPDVADSDLATYQSSVCIGTHVALSDLLVVSDTMSSIEHVRVSLLETLVGQFMKDSPVVYQFELATHHDQFTDDEWSIACSMANIAFIPQIFDVETKFVNNPQLNRTEFNWVREDTVLCIATHLDDERCLQAAVSRLISAILEKNNNPGDYFGVAFSVLHCVVVNVVTGGDATIFSHTGALQFLPPFFADSPSTPGIVALARLAHRFDPALFMRAYKLQVRNRQRPTVYKWNTHRNSSLTREVDDVRHGVSYPVLPAEILQEIALHLGVDDLFTFGLVSKAYREVASVILRYPQICGFRLVAPPKENPQCSQQPEYSLLGAAFSAIKPGIRATTVYFGFHWTQLDTSMVCIPVAENPLLSLSVPFAAAKFPGDGRCICGVKKSDCDNDNLTYGKRCSNI